MESDNFISLSDPPACAFAQIFLAAAAAAAALDDEIPLYGLTVSMGERIAQQS